MAFTGTLMASGNAMPLNAARVGPVA